MTHLKSTIEHNREEASNDINAVSDLLSAFSGEVDKKYKKIETDTFNLQNFAIIPNDVHR